MSVVLANHQRARKINLHLLRQITDSLLAELKIQNAGLEINFVTTKAMKLLNKKFLQHAGSTDVITFDYADNVGQAARRFPKPLGRKTDKRDARPAVHGEIFICMDEAVGQARKFRTSWQSETVRYLVHGVLHLLDYDDSRPGDRRKMKQAENRLLRRFSRRFSLAQLERVTRLSPCKSH